MTDRKLVALLSLTADGFLGGRSPRRSRWPILYSFTASFAARCSWEKGTTEEPPSAVSYQLDRGVSVVQIMTDRKLMTLLSLTADG
jgi:hypothetical protein